MNKSNPPGWVTFWDCAAGHSGGSLGWVTLADRLWLGFVLGFQFGLAYALANWLGRGLGLWLGLALALALWLGAASG